MSVDHHFPRFHVRPRTGYVNDPNGPIHVGGRWQLFFQYVLDTPRRGPVLWGHASSADLATWRLHEPVIRPSPDAYDRDGCWSGNTVVAGGELHAFYSGFRHGHPYQSVVVATSSDDGASFGPPRPVVADPDPAEGVAQFRDPFVWEENGVWLMLVGAGDRSGGASARLYESADLETWAYRGPFAASPRTVTSDGIDTGMMWECPQLFSFGERDALLVCAMVPDHFGDVIAVTGVRADGGLRDARITRVDQGPNFYAPSALRESHAGPLLWGWITEGRSDDWAIEADWSGMLSLPRSVDLTADGRLTSRPAAALEALREDTVESPFEEVGAQFEVELELHGERDRTTPTLLSLRCGSEEHLDVVVDWDAGQIRVDREAASADPRAHAGSFSFDEPALRSSEPVRIRWFVDGSVSELFTSSGRSSTLRFYPTTPPPWRLEVAGLAPADTVRTWALRSLGEGEDPVSERGTVL